DFGEADGTAVFDASGNGNVGTISGATRASEGKYGGALSFNGTDSWVTVADADSLDLTSGMTLEAWVYPTAIDGWECVVLKEDSTDLAYALYADNNGEDAGWPRRPIVSAREGDTTYWTSGATQLDTDTWTHLPTTYDGTTLRMYVNGVQISSLTQAGSI